MRDERLEKLARLLVDYSGAVSLELKPWPLGAPDPESILERMRGALEYTRTALVDDPHAAKNRW